MYPGTLVGESLAAAVGVEEPYRKGTGDGMWRTLVVPPPPAHQPPCATNTASHGAFPDTMLFVCFCDDGTRCGRYRRQNSGMLTL